MTSTSLPRGLQAQAAAKVSFNNSARQAQNAQSQAVAFASNADNLDTGTIQPDQLPIATTTSPGAVQPDGTTIDVDPSGIISTASPRPCTVHTVATLPTGLSSPYNDGLFVSDATMTMTAGIGTVVVGGGANKVPVYTTDGGTSWLIG